MSNIKSRLRALENRSPKRRRKGQIACAGILGKPRPGATEAEWAKYEQEKQRVEQRARELEKKGYEHFITYYEVCDTKKEADRIRESGNHDKQN